MWWWWWAWIAFVFIVLLMPLSVGWGQRGWGPPYPTYYRRRYYARYPTAPIAPEPGDVDPLDPNVPPMRDRVVVDDGRTAMGTYPGQSWSWLADLLWLGVLAAIAWAVYLWVT